MRSASLARRQRKEEGGSGIILNVELVSMLARVRRLHQQAWITVRDPMVHLKVHPTHRSKHTTVRTMHLERFHLINPSEQVLVGRYPQEGLTHDDEARQL